MSASIPSTQRALLLTQAGQPLQLRTDWPVPHPTKQGQVLLKVHASSLNPIDYHAHKMNMFQMPLPGPLGWDVSGVVVAVGPSTHQFKAGDEVFGCTALNEAGAFAEYQLTDALWLAHKPKEMQHTVAACLGVAGLSAFLGLEQVKMDRTTTVFIPGGSGGVGHIALGLARCMGAGKLITNASKHEALDWLKNTLKVDVVFNYKEMETVKAVLDATGGKGADVVFDCTYKDASYQQSVEAMKEGGTWIVLNNSEPKPELLRAVEAKRGHFKRCDLSPFTHTRDKVPTVLVPKLEQMAAWVCEGKLNVHISETVKLDQVENGMQKLEKDQHKGGKIAVSLM